MGTVPQKVLNWLHGALKSVRYPCTIFMALIVNGYIRNTKMSHEPTRMSPKHFPTIPTSLSRQMSIVWNSSF